MTDEGGYCVATKATIGNASYLCIVMGAVKQGTKICSFEIANALIKYAKASLGFTKVMEKGALICEIPIDMALSKASTKETNPTVRACIAEDVVLFLPKDTDPQTEISYKYYLYSDSLTAPIASGERVGSVDFFYNGELIQTVPLILGEDAEANEFLLKMQKFKGAVFSRTTLISIVLFCIILAFYLSCEKKAMRRRAKKSFKITNSKKL